MRMIASCVLAAAISVTWQYAALAAPVCLANGRAYQIGQVACLTVLGTEQLSRCELVLNNTSWEKIKDGCAETATPPQPQPAPETTNPPDANDPTPDEY